MAPDRRNLILDAAITVIARTGVRGLRVADASVMPSTISGATNAPSIMIGGRAVEFIRAGNR